VLLRFPSLPPVFRSATRSPTKRLRESVYPPHRGQLGVGDYNLSRCNRTKTNHRLLAIEASRKATPWPKPAVAVKPIGDRRLSVRAPNVQATAGSSARRARMVWRADSKSARRGRNVFQPISQNKKASRGERRVKAFPTFRTRSRNAYQLHPEAIRDQRTSPMVAPNCTPRSPPDRKATRRRTPSPARAGSIWPPPPHRRRRCRELLANRH
jgi:hypothetical protein